MINKDMLTPVHTSITNATLDGENCICVVKKDKINIPDENTYAFLNTSHFHNGTIEGIFQSRLLKDAPDHARGFLGIVFRAAPDSSEFESFYVRPTNGRNCTDPVRKAHGCQYFTFPGYTFSYYREFGITDYEAPVGLDLNEWFTLKAVIDEDTATFYVNDTKALYVPHLKHGTGTYGHVGIFTDIGTEGYVKDLTVLCKD